MAHGGGGVLLQHSLYFCESLKFFLITKTKGKKRETEAWRQNRMQGILRNVAWWWRRRAFRI